MFGLYIVGEDGGVLGIVGEFELFMLSDKYFGSSDGFRRFFEYFCIFLGVFLKILLKDFFIILVIILLLIKFFKK